MSSLKFKQIPKKFLSFRNIATCAPSQNLFDDIAPAKTFERLHRHERASSGIGHAQNKTHRPFQYGDTGLTLYVFEKLNWYYGRFGKGTRYGVWYGSLEEETSIKEVLYYRLIESHELFKNPKIRDPFIVCQRAMFKARCQAPRLVDLTKEKKYYAHLTDEDYSFCQNLGKKAIHEKIDAFFTPSARNPQGICTPIFNPSILKDNFIYYFDLVIHRNFEVEFRKTHIKMMEVPETWKQ